MNISFVQIFRPMNHYEMPKVLSPVSGTVVHVWKKLVQECQFIYAPVSEQAIALDYLELHM